MDSNAIFEGVNYFFSFSLRLFCISLFIYLYFILFYFIFFFVNLGLTDLI